MEDSNDEEEEEAVMDIDSCDKKNPLAVVDYIDDIYDFYKKNEVSKLLLVFCFHVNMFILVFSDCDCFFLSVVVS